MLLRLNRKVLAAFSCELRPRRWWRLLLMQTQATGTEDLSEVLDVEIIFTQAAVLTAEALSCCPRLQSLTRELNTRAFV